MFSAPPRIETGKKSGSFFDYAKIFFLLFQGCALTCKKRQDDIFEGVEKNKFDFFLPPKITFCKFAILLISLERLAGFDQKMCSAARFKISRAVTRSDWKQ